jgi:small subunit ribosomal protein S20
MANIKSAKKRVLITLKKHDRNRVVRSAVKTHVTRVRRLVDGGETAPVAEVNAAVKALDQAAERGILHRNNAARRKSRLMRMVAKASALAADPEAAARAAAEAKAHAKGTAKSKTKAGKKAAAAKSAAARSTPRK